jgi:hypothetical protein
MGLWACSESEPSLNFLWGQVQWAKCIIKWQKGGMLHVRDNGRNLFDGL